MKSEIIYKRKYWVNISIGSSRYGKNHEGMTLMTHEWEALDPS